MENTKVVEWNDLYLYAKNHYGKSMDRISDLRIILSHNLALNPEDVRVGGMVTILLNTVYKHFNQNSFVDFMTNIDPLESWKVGYCHKLTPDFKVGTYTEEYYYEHAVIYACLSILSLTKVYDTTTNTHLLNIGDVNPEIIKLLPCNLEIA